MQTIHPQRKTLPQDYLHRLCGQTPSSTTPPVALPQQCLPPHQQGQAWRDRWWWWLWAMQDETPSSPESLHPSDDWPRTLSWRMGLGSQTRMQQFAGGNDSIAGDQMGGIPRVSHRIYFPDSLQKPLPTQMAPMQRHNRCIGTSSIKKFCQDCSLQGSIGAQSAQHRHTNTSKSEPFPCQHQHPNFWSALLKFNAAVPIRLQPTKHARKDTGVHPVQNDRLKHNINKPVDMDTQTDKTENINQHLIPRPCYVYVHSAGSQCKLRPHLMDKLVGPTQSQHLNQRRHLSKDW